MMACIWQVIRSPTGAVFVKPSLRRGLVPNVLKGLVQARASVKTAMKAATAAHGPDSPLVAVLNARQLALKVST